MNKVMLFNYNSKISLSLVNIQAGFQTDYWAALNLARKCKVDFLVENQVDKNLETNKDLTLECDIELCQKDQNCGSLLPQPTCPWYKYSL